MSDQSDRQKKYYAVFSKGRENTQDSDMMFDGDDLEILKGLGLLMCSRFSYGTTGTFRRELWANVDKRDSIEVLDQCYINIGFPKPVFDGLLFEIPYDSPFAVNKIFNRLITIGYTDPKADQTTYCSDTNFILCDKPELYVEFLSIFMMETFDDDYDSRRDISE